MINWTVMRRLILAIAVLALAASPTSALAGPNSRVGGMTLDELVSRLEQTIPETWHVVEADTARVPLGWTGPEQGLYVMLEDTRTRFFHPNGFHYFSFYRVWLVPSDWEGEMRVTPYVSDSVPAYLLGVNDSYSVFVHTAGGNVWEDGPKALCAALDLDGICFTDLTRRVVDLDFEERLKASLASVPKDGDTLVPSPQRIIGLSGAGSSLYLEYIFSEDSEQDETSTEMASLTESLAESVFIAFPEVESVYLRRCGSDTFTDTIVARD